MSETKVPTVVIIGASVAGTGLARALEKSLKPGQAKIILIEKRAYYQHNFASVRGVVDLDFAKQTFLDYTKVFKNPEMGSCIQGTVTKVTEKEVILASGETVPFDYLAIASGASYVAPFRSSAETKDEAMAVFQKTFDSINAAKSLLVVGGGAVGCEVAGEIKSKFPEKV
jgi:NADH dehydrogenase FAD-containing subunit